MRLLYPWWLLVALLGPAVLLWIRRRQGKLGGLGYPELAHVRSLPGQARVKWINVPTLLGLGALALFAVAMARPQSHWEEQEQEIMGLDIMLVLDVSGSMKSQDFQPQDRFHVAREVLQEFVQDRPADRLGLVVFARRAFTQCPLTVDRAALVNLLQQTRIGMITDGTALGSAIATAANRLRKSEAKSKVMILLTDGRNNAGPVDPATAAEAAGALGIRIYTIGAGKPGIHPFPVDDPVWGRRYVKVPLELDEETLRTVAEATGGQYYRAKTEDSLARIYREIGQLEKSRLKVRTVTRHRELFPWVVVPGLALLWLGWMAEHVVLRRLP